MKNKKKLAIIGGGASGFFCAALLAEMSECSDIEITIYEMLQDPMQKLLASGGGRCNLTNDIDDFKELVKHYPRGEKFLYSVFSKFNVQDTLSWFENHGLKTYVEKDNSVFPQCNSSAKLAAILIQTAQNANLRFLNNKQVKTISKENEKFIVQTANSKELYDYVLITTGGKKSIKAKIKNYNGYEIAKNLGHKIIEPQLALAPLMTVDKETGTLAGIVMSDVLLEARQNQKAIAQTRGNLLFTHRGFSGPAAINMSSYLTGISMSIKDPVELVIINERFDNYKEVDKYLLTAFDEFPKKNIINLLIDFYPRNLSKYLLKRLNIDPDAKVHSIQKDQRQQLAKIIKEARFQAKSIDTTTAMVTAGGVCCDEINAKTMESRLVSGLYFAGEIVNVDGLCGGFNLQFAWSSAYAVASGLAKLMNINSSLP